MEDFFESANYKFGWKFLKQGSKNTHNEFIAVT